LHSINPKKSLKPLYIENVKKHEYYKIQIYKGHQIILAESFSEVGNCNVGCNAGKSSLLYATNTITEINYIPQYT